MSKPNNADPKVIAAESLAANILRKVSDGHIEYNINIELSVNAMPLVKKQNKNIVLIHDGDLQCFIDKTNKDHVSQLTRIMEYKIRTATEQLTHAKAALKQIKELK